MQRTADGAHDKNWTGRPGKTAALIVREQDTGLLTQGRYGMEAAGILVLEIDSQLPRRYQDKVDVEATVELAVDWLRQCCSLGYS